MSATLDDTSKVIRRYLVKNADWVRVELPDEAFLPGDSQLTQYIIRYVVSLIPMFLFFSLYSLESVYGCFSSIWFLKLSS